MIKHKLLLIALVATSILIPAAVAEAQGISISVGDRPYYSHGPRYWAGDYEMIWVPGHRSRVTRRWIHGHYIRTENRRHRSHRRHDQRRFEDRRDEGRDDIRTEIRESVRR